ncbi:MAG: hypothetical protein A3H98_12165 [Bacteroidetes bacterium RIFCSPLOWO2_02_FULL_36_8]|nr:MAG: hypothetical protein A3H98_12165 [Bacteroidetes bacterium RIFCSPLOWO2_02_FULL_36_8]OFY70226.1 MAG: hypothetical protein A3G23_08765 [Bacteroidetes bacterium RIFCSPLOWO2_12_FULL_37_12]
MNLSLFPFFRFTFLLITGFLLAPVFELKINFIFWLWGILSASYLFLSIFWKKIKIPRLFTIKKILLVFIIISGGIILKIETNPLRDENHISKQIPEKKWKKEDFRYIAVVSTFPNEKNKNFKTELEVEFIYKEKKWKPATGKIFTTFKKDSLNKIIPEYGDRLVVDGFPEKIISTGNPGQFDPFAYFSTHGIFHKQKIKTWKVIEHNYKTNPLYALSQKCRLLLSKQLTQYIEDIRSRSVAISVLLGDKTQLDNALMQAYSHTGAMHVLAVSGLHVAILFIILQHLTSFLLRLKNGNHLQTGVIFLLLLFYAFLTGLSPSVLRSVFMFSLILVSKTFQRQSNILNTLFSSAFFLLLYNPMFMYDVGFQLSYTAVISIVIFQKPIHGLVHTKNKIIEFVWNITSVSLAAQVFTLPITLGCFGQYPVYSLLSNLLVIPLSTFILYGGTALFTVSFIPWLAKTVGFILNILLLIMNNGILWIEKLPFASLQVPMFDYVKVGCLYAIIFSLMLFGRTRILIFFAVFVFFSGFIIFNVKKEDVHLKNRRELIVYNVRSKFLMEINKGYGSEIYADAPESDSILQNVYLKPSFNNRGVKTHRWHNLTYSDTSAIQFFALGGKKIALVKNDTCLPNPDTLPVKIDFLIIKNKLISKPILKKLLLLFKPEYLVTVGLKNSYLTKWLQMQCDRQKTKRYDLNQSGTFRFVVEE